jgi:hypothetical protein
MSDIIKIGVIGDGPIGNLVVAKLIIEHWHNKSNGKKIEIIHHTTKRAETKGYERRHVLYITEELVNILENNVLICDNCLKDIANKQRITQESRDILLFSTRILEETLIRSIQNNDKCKNDECSYIPLVYDTKEKLPDYSKLGYNYIFFAIGSNAGSVRSQYFYTPTIPQSNTIKIVSEQSEPIVIFYTKLGVQNKEGEGHRLHQEDKDSTITKISKNELEKVGIDIYELEVFANIIYTFFDKFQDFAKIFLESQKSSKSPKSQKSKDIEYYDKFLNGHIVNLFQRNNLSLNGYHNFSDYMFKFQSCLTAMQVMFKEDAAIFQAYKKFIYNLNMRTHPNTLKFNQMYDLIVESDESISLLLKNYTKLIKNLLIRSFTNPNLEGCSRRKTSLKELKCLEHTFLVNVVGQSLNSYGIINNNQLVYATKKEETRYFMIGDMANAYSPGISVELGINFVNYIIPMFYNFYINERKTILSCLELNIGDILDDLLSDKYTSLLDKKITGQSQRSSEINTLRLLIENIKSNYIRNIATLCDDNDIFITYYNIVLLIQFIKNIELIIDDKNILDIAKIFKPSNYKIINNSNDYSNELERLRQN